jgi:WS/DGAT/MGAT family acyltransferase
MATVGRLSDADSLLWTIGQDPVLRSPIVAVLTLDSPPNWDALVARVSHLVTQEPRLSAVPVSHPLHNPDWCTDPDFDLAFHLHHIAAPPPATLRYVLDTAAQMGSTDFDPARPLWEAVLISGLSDGQAAVILKIHHAVIDGIAGMSLLAGLLGLSVEDSLATPVAPTTHHHHHHHPALPNLITLPYRTARTALHAATNPPAALSALRADLSTITKLVAPAPSPLSPLLRRRGVAHHYDVLAFPPNTLANCAHAQRSTLNDIFLTGVLGGLRRYHNAHGTALRSLRVLVPISVRTDSDPAGGNRFVPARFVLDATLLQPRPALSHVRTTMSAWKHTPSLAVADPLTSLINALPHPLAIRLFGSMLKGDDVVVTNVPGPPVTSYLAGAKLTAFYAFAPTSGAALNVALITQADAEYLGINIDSAALPDPQVLHHCLSESFAELIALPKLP